MTPKAEGGKYSMLEEHKAIVRRFYDELWNQGHLALAGEIVATDYVRHAPNPTRGPEGITQVITMIRKAWPDLHVVIEDIIAEGDKVVVRWVSRGTHRGEFRGAAPTGKQTEVRGITISRFAGGKIAEDWAQWDTFGLMQQLGLPTPSAQTDR